MKKIYYIHIFVVAILVCCFLSCVDDTFFSAPQPQELNGFSLNEAKGYFLEKAMEQPSRSSSTNEMIPLSPGDFVPLWNVAAPSVMNGLACYDIPINETYSYQVLYSKERQGTMNVSKVKVYQKLVILKDIRKSRMSQYILSLIPEKQYELLKGQRIPNLFITRGDKGGYSGIAIYSSLYTGMTVRVDTYDKGRKIKGTYLLGAKDTEELRERIEIAQEQLCMLSLQMKKKVVSRGECDYDYGYDWDGGWLDEVIITPEEEYGHWGMTDEEWLESSRPDSNVDPQPEPAPEEFPDDDSQPYPEEESEEDNKPNISGFNPEEESKVKAAIDNLYVKLPNIDLGGIIIKKGESKGNAYVKPEDGTLMLNNLYFRNDLNDNDRTAILYHEIYHIQNEHYGEIEVLELPEQLELDNIPPHINEHIRNEIQDIVEEYYSEYPENVRDIIFQSFYENDISILEIKEPEFYENELETYKEEKLIFSDDELSETYKYDREYAEWKYEQILQISNQYFNE